MTAMLGTSRGSLEVPQLPQGSIELEPPPELEPHEGAAGVLMMALPMLGSVGAIVFVAAGGAGSAGPARYIASGMFLVAMLGFVFVQLDRQRKQRADKVGGGRREYLRYLTTVRTTVRAAADQQRRSLTWRFPEPDALPALAEDRTRLWERQRDDEEFLQVRYGVAPQELALQLVAPQTAPIDQLDPVAASALHRLIAVHRVQPDLPAALRLGAFSRIEVTGDVAHARALARALVCSAAAAHTPDDLVVAVLGSSAALQEWDWVKWLPHAHSPERNDALGRSRMLGDSLDELFELLPADVRDRPRFTGASTDTTPHLLLVVDGTQVPPGGALLPEEGLEGVTVLELPARWGELDDATRLRLHLEPALLPGGRVPLTAVRLREQPARAAGDQMSLASAEAFARRLAPLETDDGPVREDTTKAAPELLDLLGLGDVHDLDLERAWRPRPERDRLRVPIGVGDTGSPVHLDIKESAQQGMGPHGLVIGATGSGKSEFLRTLVLGLLATHSSETLNMVLVDFKGGATFAGLSGAPHVSAVITNLEGELTLVDRMQDALSGEMVRRQELLRASGNYASLRDYEKARADGADLEPLPSLFICVDEFSEMLSAKPDFIELFVAIGRLGRSLGIHLLLASQRLEEGRLRGLESHLSYRVGLRTFSGAESRAVIGVPDAYELPPVPGLGYLKPDQSTLLRFKASYVSGPPPKRGRKGKRSASGQTTILPFTAAHVLPPQSLADDPEPDVVEAVPESTDGRSIIDIAVATFEGRGPEAHQVWLPPLDVPDTLDELLPDLVETPEHGLHSPARRAHGGLRVPLGTVDRPREQRRDVLEADLQGAGGHVAVVGGPRSGKSTLLRTLVAGVALGSTPTESQFYVLDFGGGTFASMAELPHVAGVATRSEPDTVRRTYAEIVGIVDKRERYFRSQGIDSIETYRQRRAEGTADDGYGDVFLVVDGWSTLRSDFDDLELGIQTLAQRGLTFGLHVITAAGRWADFRPAIRDLFGNRFELRLGDPMDSEIDRKIAQLVPEGRSGRGLVARWGSKLHFLGALPRVDGNADPRTVGRGVEDLVERSRKAWQGPQGPKLRLLPSRIDLGDVLTQAEKIFGLADQKLYVAIDERDLAPVGLDVDAEPHLVVFGDSRSGKSGLLRTYLHEVMRTRTPKQAQVLTIDYRRSLLGEVPDDYQISYLTSAAQVQEEMSGLAQWLQKRMPGNDVTPQQLRDRSWWTGADVFVVVDDYDLVATGSSSPVAPLVPLLGQARDVGLHLVVARRAGGAGRAGYESVLQSLRELAMPGILLSGDPQEGALLGNTKPRKAGPGRGQLVTRDRGTEVVHLAWKEPSL